MTPTPLTLRFLLYLDEDSHSHLLAELLRRAGMDVLRSTEAGMDGAKDDRQLAFAASNERVIYTANAKDYARLHRDYLNSGQPFRRRYLGTWAPSDSRAGSPYSSIVGKRERSGNAKSTGIPESVGRPGRTLKLLTASE